MKYVDELRDDDLPGKPGDADHSWLGLMRFDYVTMTEALGGDATALQAFDAARRRPGRGGLPAVSRAATSVDALRRRRRAATAREPRARRRRPRDREPAQFIGIVGPSGSGKTTLLRAILGIVRAGAGHASTGAPGLRVGYVPQVETVNWNFPVTVGECVLMARTRGRLLPWASRGRARARSRPMLDRLGIGGLAEPPHPRALGRPAAAGLHRPRAARAGPSCCCWTSRPRASTCAPATRSCTCSTTSTPTGSRSCSRPTTSTASPPTCPRLVCLNREVIGAGRAQRGAHAATSSSAPTARRWRCSSTPACRVVVDGFARHADRPSPREAGA